ncbi:MAG: ferritin-like domain-containing protein, partial [Chloroflexota bacterium]|nr:ferritin-like domain-containing protein [Chloroflexota bacterium]
ENFEIATYRAIITAAQDTGDTDTVHVCQQILDDEQAMARFLDDRMPALVDRIVRQAMSASS